MFLETSLSPSIQLWPRMYFYHHLFALPTSQIAFNQKENTRVYKCIPSTDTAIIWNNTHLILWPDPFCIKSFRSSLMLCVVSTINQLQHCLSMLQWTRPFSCWWTCLFSVPFIAKLTPPKVSPYVSSPTINSTLVRTAELQLFESATVLNWGPLHLQLC